MKTMSPNDLGKKFIVEECQKLKIGDCLKNFKLSFKETVLKSELDVFKQSVELTTTKTGFNGIRFWFKCPLCLKWIGVLFVHPLDGRIGCRECLNLEYRKRRYKGMAECDLL